ncbi:MAG: hypothetical protein RLZZ28_2612 [Bacteroidota bacterium]|jgi:hypothetical protein
MAALKRIIFLLLFAGGFFHCFAQSDAAANKPESTAARQILMPLEKSVADSAKIPVKDSLIIANALKDSLKTDSIHKAAIAKTGFKDTSSYRKYQAHAYLPLNKAPVFMLIDYHQHNSKDELFYLLVAIVFVLAFIRAIFPKYFRNLFLLFFQTSIRQKQTRDQLLQDNLASLLINLLFVISMGLYFTLLIKYHNWSEAPFWWLALGSVSILTGIYLLKYLFLLFTGWVFNTAEAASSYIFVVFLVNKILGILIIPVLLIIAFSTPEIVTIAVTISFGLILLFFAYRYWISFAAIRNKLNVNALHFLLYLCAVELLPLVLIYKVLMNLFKGSF